MYYIDDFVQPYQNELAFNTLLLENLQMPIQHQFRIIPLRMLKVFIAVLIMVFAPQSYAEKMSNGQMAGIIRSANHPCAKVLELQSTGENSWSVQCNSGSFNVTHNADGQFSVNTSNK